MSVGTIRTEVRGLELTLDDQDLLLSRSGENLVVPARLSPDDAERLRLEMGKAQLWEWNQFEELKMRAELRSRRQLAAWLVMCVAALSAYLGYPDYYLCAFFAAASVFLWWRAGHLEQQAEQEAQGERNRFRPEWDYIRERLEESDTE